MKVKARYFILICLCLALCLFLAACGTPDPECPPHDDADGDGICDNCKTDIDDDDDKDDDEDDEDLVPSLDGISFPDKEVTYNGQKHSLSITGELPEDVLVSYVGNGKTNAGEHEVVAKFYYKGEEIAGSEMTATLTITKGTYNLEGVELPSVEVTYDGKKHSTELVGDLPLGVRADYVITDANGNEVDEIRDAGVYNVYVIFRGDTANYHPVDPLCATVTVRLASISGITFRDAVIDYDGTAKSISVSGLPSGVTVNYSGNGQVAPGKYTVVASFDVGENFEPLADMSAVMTIKVDDPTAWPTAGLIYEKFSNNTVSGYRVTGVEGSPEVIIIPPTHNGEAVVAIKSDAFMGMESIKYAYLPDSISAIGNRVFDGCTELKYIRLGNAVSIGGKAFRNTALVEIALPDSLTWLGEGVLEGVMIEKITLPFLGSSKTDKSGSMGYLFGADGYAGNAFYVPSSLKYVALSNECRVIPEYAFRGLAGLQTLVLGHGIEKIGNSAFGGCTGLLDVFIPLSVEEIFADAKAENSPFYGCSSELMLVFESVSATSGYGRYFAHIGEDDTALVIYNKTYEDFVMNKDSYRIADVTDATLAGIFVGEELVSGFGPDVLLYEIDADLKTGYGIVSAIAMSSAARVEIIQASVSTNSIATVTVTSGDGKTTKVYKITFIMDDDFTASAEVVNKNGASGTVTFVVDDGYHPTATFMKSMMEKYSALAVTYAVKTSKFASLTTADSDGDGLNEYIMDNGKYTYTKDQATIDFWLDILSVGKSEIASHSHTHAFWGVNDNGGAQESVSTSGVPANRIYSTLPVGSASAEIYASQQIIKDIFGETSRGIAYVTPGIAPKGGGTVISTSAAVSILNMSVRLVNDTAINVVGNKITLNSNSEINLESVVAILMAGTQIQTTADTSESVLKAGTVVKVIGTNLSATLTNSSAISVDSKGAVSLGAESDAQLSGGASISLPAKTPITTSADTSSGTLAAGTAIVVNGAYAIIPAGSTIKGYNDYFKNVLYENAISDLTIIGARSTGSKLFVASDFAGTNGVANRLSQDAYMVKATDDPSTWTKKIDSAVSGGKWLSFCIHAITDTLDSSVENQGGHMILKENAEVMFSHAVSYGDKLWIATLTDATLYYHEWSTAKVTSDYSDGKITVSLTDEEDDDIYNMALTVKVYVPAIWDGASVGDKELEIKTDDAGAFVYVDIAPESSLEIIGK